MFSRAEYLKFRVDPEDDDSRFFDTLIVNYHTTYLHIPEDS